MKDITSTIKHIPGAFTPMVVEQSKSNMQIISVFDRLMQDRIIFLGEGIDDFLANTINAQLLFLDSITDEENPEPIWLYINSPGGSVYSGLAIYDTMQMIKSPVYTCVMGLAASMGFILSIAGEKGHRYALPNSKLMLHQPLGGTGYGQATEIDIYNDEMQKVKSTLYDIIVKHTNADLKKVKKDGERDKWLTAEESLTYGAIDEIKSKML